VNGDKWTELLQSKRRDTKKVTILASVKYRITKPQSAEEKQNTVRNKLKEYLQIMWHRVRLQQKNYLWRNGTQGFY
jgi:hypothetical protein